MRVLLRLFTCVSAASDGSVIPKRVVEEYLRSQEYRNSMDKGLTLIGVTHRDRNLKASPNGNLLAGVTGKDDNLLLNRNSVGRIEKIFLPEDPSDEWCYGVGYIFDETLMDKESAEAIRQVKGLIRNGVKLTTSAVIVGLWNSKEECEKIVNIKGNDITLNPAFSKGGKEPAGIVKVLEDENRR